jgi:hypothetical protein
MIPIVPENNDAKDSGEATYNRKVRAHTNVHESVAQHSGKRNLRRRDDVDGGGNFKSLSSSFHLSEGPRNSRSSVLD